MLVVTSPINSKPKAYATLPDDAAKTFCDGVICKFSLTDAQKDSLKVSSFYCAFIIWSIINAKFLSWMINRTFYAGFIDVYGSYLWSLTV